MADSIIQTERIKQEYKWCFICGKPYSDRHHIFGRSNRKFSEEDGLVVYLCRHHHEMAHEGGEFMDELHKIGQMAYEEKHTRDEFMNRYGRNYLGGEEE